MKFDCTLEDMIQIAIKPIHNKKHSSGMKFYKEENPSLSFEAKKLEITKRSIPVYDVYEVKIDGEIFGMILNRNGWGVDAKGHAITAADKEYLITKAQSMGYKS